MGSRCRSDGWGSPRVLSALAVGWDLLGVSAGVDLE